MTRATELRGGIDRRRQPRGGRRPADLEGLSPLVMVVGDHASVGDATGAVLAKLKFAVAPSATVDEALRVLATLRPDLIVAKGDDAGRIRRENPEYRSVIVVTDAMRQDPNLLIEEVRGALRAPA
jgi:CheY-like chemotaxis protein